MQVTKIGHCCLVVEVKGVKVMTDPGMYSFGVEDFSEIDAVVITHEHEDHLHIESLEAVLRRNPNTKVICNSSVARILSEKGIGATVLEGTAVGDVKGMRIEARDAKHEEIYEEIGQVQNTGYFIDSLFYPGDSFADPGKAVDTLALPVSGPWCKISQAIRYAIALKPQFVFPVHDGILRDEAIGVAHFAPSQVLPKNGIAFTALKPGQSIDI